MRRESLRRPSGWLELQVRSRIAAADRPLTVCEIAMQIRRTEPGIHNSAVFRTVNRLMAAHDITRVELLAGYMTRGSDDDMLMLCERCGWHRIIANAAPPEALDRLSRDHHFTPSRYVIEIVGTCDACRSKVGEPISTTETTLE